MTPDEIRLYELERDRLLGLNRSGARIEVQSGRMIGKVQAGKLALGDQVHKCADLVRDGQDSARILLVRRDGEYEVVVRKAVIEGKATIKSSGQ